MLEAEVAVIRERVLNRLREDFPALRERYGVASLGLFGSVARDEDGPDSDVDLLVTFRDEPTFTGFMGLKEDLEKLLGRRVDLVTASGLKERIRERVMAELLHVA